MLLKFVNGQQEIVRDLHVLFVQPKREYQPGGLPCATMNIPYGGVVWGSVISGHAKRNGEPTIDGHDIRGSVENGGSTKCANARGNNR